MKQDSENHEGRESKGQNVPQSAPSQCVAGKSSERVKEGREAHGSTAQEHFRLKDAN